MHRRVTSEMELARMALVRVSSVVSGMPVRGPGAMAGRIMAAGMHSWVRSGMRESRRSHGNQASTTKRERECIGIHLVLFQYTRRGQRAAANDMATARYLLTSRLTWCGLCQPQLPRSGPLVRQS